MGVGGATGFALISRANRRRGRPRRTRAHRSAVTDQFVVVRVQPGDQFGARTGAAVRIRAGLSVAVRVAGGLASDPVRPPLPQPNPPRTSISPRAPHAYCPRPD